ncbi:SRPBCC family protein [Nocardia sp. NPDC050697]|uniref:SRPBCC family protein n=1 Tax=Nocardia sp. NPDC050697 TaxID=3155158 RepID=UPI0034077814
MDRRAEVAAPSDFAFGFVTDHRTVPSWMFGISRFEPSGDRTAGAGARFAATFSGVLSYTFELVATEWEDGAAIVLESAEPPQVRARVEFRPRGARVTEIRIRVEYRIPGGLAAAALRRMNDVVAGRAARYVESNLRRELESAYAAAHRGAAG